MATVMLTRCAPLVIRGAIVAPYAMVVNLTACKAHRDLKLGLTSPEHAQHTVSKISFGRMKGVQADGTYTVDDREGFQSIYCA